MKKKLFSKRFGAVLLATVAMTSSAVYARDIGSLTHYKITTSEQTSPYLNKYILGYENGGRYVFNFESTSSGDSSAGVKHRLVNSDGESRSGSTITYSGGRSQCTNTATNGYIYALMTESGDVFDSAFYINASWSPDEF